MLSPIQPAKHCFSVTDFNAAADGTTKDTKAIQDAINACAENGGGVVYFAPGCYLSGTIDLKTNVTLHLEAGATLLGSKDIADYKHQPYLHTPTDGSLLQADGVENITVQGRGCIDGQGPAFWLDEYCNEKVLRPKKERPHSLLFFANCRNILIKDVTIRNSPCYTVWTLGCETINIHSIEINNPLNGPNTDALDIDCCRNVRISDCHIVAGDDCIALKSDAKRLGRYFPCENITVTNCTLSSTTCAIRVGYEGDSPIRNCTFSNLAIYDSVKAIDVISILPDLGIEFTKISEGAQIDNIIFSDIVMTNVQNPIYIWQGNETGGNFTGHIANLSINNIIAQAQSFSFIGSTTDKPIRNLSLNNVKINITGQIESPDFEMPIVWGGKKVPYGIYAHNIDHLELDRLSIQLPQPINNWKAPLKCENVKNLTITK